MHTHSFSVDFARETGRIKPVHGVNNGPLCFGGLIDLTPWHQRLAFPWVRLHDCDWPADTYMDLHTIVRDFDADPQDPASYDFALTDEYIARIVALGSRIVYRLGCRIEWTRHRRHAHPPKDPRRWAQFCLGVIRHCNEGWADGHRWDIRHWEIWNEADGGLGMWSGTWEQYIDLYVTAATTIKGAFPQLHVGGPAFCQFTDDGRPKLERFLASCRERSVPLDFFSWHTYCGRDLANLGRLASEVRATLDRHGFTATPSHLNEWNCAPDGDWKDLPRFSAGLSGPRGASGVAACLAYLQDLPVDVPFLYTADCQIYGLFSRAGEPQRNYRAVEAFCALLATPRRCQAEGADPGQGLAILAGLAEDDRSARVLLANYVASGRCRFPLRLAGLPWPGATTLTLRRVDAAEALDRSETRTLPAGDAAWDVELPEATTLLLELAPAG